MPPKRESLPSARRGMAEKNEPRSVSFLIPMRRASDRYLPRLRIVLFLVAILLLEVLRHG